MGIRLAVAVSCFAVAGLLPLVAVAQGSANFEAAIGEPFGVARLVVAGDAEVAGALETNNLTIVERDGRVLYPVFTTGKIRKILGEILGIEMSGGPSLQVMFLFQGDAPLHVTVSTPQAREYTLTLRPPLPRARERLLLQWWREYNAVAAQQLKESDYPPVAQTYLTAMLSRRMGLPLPATSAPRAALRAGSDREPAEIKESLELLLGMERLRLATMRESMLRRADRAAPANLPLPAEIGFGPPPPAEFDPQVEIEPLAQHVAEEWFYIRFGRLANQTWLDKLTAEYGGEIGSMVTLRGLKGRGGQRVETQLALPPPKNALEEVVGDAMIADVALVGRDIYLEDGAAVGMLFQVRTQLFVTNQKSHRQEVAELEKDNGATLTTVRIADHDVSFLSTPDNRLRSFMALDGDFMLVTTSRAMVEQFYEAGSGTKRLADFAEFKQARTNFPLSRDDTIFAYFSSAFFRGLLTPQYQIEVARRMRSQIDMQLIQLAAWAARAERLDDDSLETLEAVGLVPAGFGARPDGGGWREVDGQLQDTLRGARGSFLPVPDVVIEGVTRAEAEQCDRRAAFHESRWKQMDPLVVAIKRHLEDDNRERIVIDGRLSLLDESKYGKWLSILGPPSTQQIQPSDAEVIFAQAHLRGGLLFPSIPPHHMFLGILDAGPLEGLQGGGLFQTIRTLRTTPGYLGAWPKPGFLDLLPFNLGGTVPDANGFSRLLLGVWRRQWNTFSAVAFDPEILSPLPRQLNAVPADQEAQIRLHVADLSQAQLAGWVNNLTYERARQSSLGNVKLLHLLHQQLHVPQAASREVAEKLLDADLICPLGGEYELAAPQAGAAAWQSSVWPESPAGPAPADYHSPILKWFRGLEAYLVKQPDHMSVHAELQLQRNPPPAVAAAEGNPAAKPLFNFNIFGGGAKPEVKPEVKREVPPPPRPMGAAEKVKKKLDF